MIVIHETATPVLMPAPSRSEQDSHHDTGTWIGEYPKAGEPIANSLVSATVQDKKASFRKSTNSSGYCVLKTRSPAPFRSHPEAG